MKNQFKILETIAVVYEKSDGCKLDTSVFNEIETELNHLSEYFKLSISQTFFTAIILGLSQSNSTVTIKDITNHVNCNPLKILKFKDDFEEMCNKNIVTKSSPKRKSNTYPLNDGYTINGKIIQAILNEAPITNIDKHKYENILELLEDVFILSEERDEENITSNELIEKFEKIIQSNKDFSLVKQISDFKLPVKEEYMFYFLIWKTITGNEDYEISRMLNDIFDIPYHRIKIMQSFIAEQNELIKFNLVEIIEAKFFNDASLKLTELSIDLLSQNDIKLFKKVKNNNLISPSQIIFKDLYFNNEEKEQLNTLKNLLKEDKFKETQNKLISKGLPKGVCILMHGSPGTGKTESVYQIARETNREIIKVDISQSKSMWFGESEKKIKKIFSDYNNISKESLITPILLFNEADALISKRKDVNFSTVSQTENAIQNIILEEMENFNGILIATTNLIKNMDLAFERRFLFKIEFNKPNLTTKAKIWKSKLTELSEEECEILANNYDFSGGQIDNIARKKEIDEIINNDKVSFENIIKYCENELFFKKKNDKLGFQY